MQTSPHLLSSAADSRNITKTSTNQTLLIKHAKLLTATANSLFDPQAVREGAAAGSSGITLFSR